MEVHDIQPRDKEGKWVPMKYIAVVGLDYTSKVDGTNIRVEPGEEVIDLADNAIAEELSAGNIAVAPEDDSMGFEPVGLFDPELSREVAEPEEEDQ